MKLSYRVLTPQGTIGISDDEAGDKRFEEIYSRFGNCEVEVYDRNEIFGVGTDNVKPLDVSTIRDLFEGNGLIIGHDEGGFYTDSGYVTNKIAVAQGFSPDNIKKVKE